MACHDFGRPVVVLGAGVLGRRIACTFVSTGYKVHIRDPSEQARADALAYIDANKSSQGFNELPRTVFRQPGEYAAFPDIDTAVKDAWLVIEAVPEKLELKIATMGELDQKAPSDCLFGSNSSSFRSAFMLDQVSEERKKQILNVHFTMPPMINTVELMTDGHTEPTAITLVHDFLAECGMIPVVARRESTGFIFNRLWAAIKREIMFILAEDVSTPEEIDKLWAHMWSRSPPPCRLMDQVGLDTVAFIEDNYVQERGLETKMTVDWLRENYVNKGHLGLKTPAKGGLYPAAEPTSKDTSSSANASTNEKSLLYLDVGLGGNVADMANVGKNGKILRRSPSGKVTTVLDSLPLPDGIDVSESTGRIFWTNMGKHTSTYDGSVSSAKLDGSDVQTLVPEGQVHTPKQLVVDDSAKKVYFCDREGLSIHRCDFDGSNHEVLVKRGNPEISEQKWDQTRWCVGITLDTQKKQVYWTQKGFSKASKGRIFRAPMEIPSGQTAENREDIETLFEGLPEPIDLELDVENKTLYWTDRGEHPIGCSLNRAYVGEKVGEKEMLARHFNEPIGLKLDTQAKKVWVADLGGSIYTVDLENNSKGKKEVVLRNEGSYTGIALA
ncbi:hypothetical protein GQ43DRAFT_452935 [Delitschia confertaspora ATCC 74209]|uniref:3-hydroxyacyl-CoA dehydrogenase, NAD binding domain protein n=1 Tax=Delitschia confertaspora ATCC 74209 TaxID=1513339 RepID=A0A9P4K097_9PLEO|nr:hypothetical protein GQ43DRAFT_452935 [Delitschia confertaspora ATCC 74209]